MYQIESVLQQSNVFKNISLLGGFMDNHDQPRFLSYQSDVTLYKSALLYTIFSDCIPIVRDAPVCPLRVCGPSKEHNEDILLNVLCNFPNV